MAPDTRTQSCLFLLSVIIVSARERTWYAFAEQRTAEAKLMGE
jgi:hypothetical protein